MTKTFAHHLALWGPGESRPTPTLTQARAYCKQLATSHYENFTVASLLLPRRLLPHFHAIYAYCRWADDLGDETGGGQHALDLLAWWRRQLLNCYSPSSPEVGNNESSLHPVMVALKATIQTYQIPPEPFLDLLRAFEQDQRLPRYETYPQLLDYCRYSANPVGRLVLYVCDCFDESRAILADQVCTGLQLANFWQDVARDYAMGRVYLPAEDRRLFGYTDEDLASRRCTPAFVNLMRHEIQAARALFDAGMALVPRIPREMRIDIDLFIQGGRAILDKIEQIGFNVWQTRPALSKFEKGKLMAGAIFRQLFR